MALFKSFLYTTASANVKAGTFSQSGFAGYTRQDAEAKPCMFLLNAYFVATGYRGGRLSLEATFVDLVCRAAPRLFANFEEYQEASPGWTSHDKVGVATSTRSGNR